MAETPCDVHTEQIKQHQERLEKLDIIVDKVRNRLPTWATFVLGALLCVIGYLLKGAGT